MTSCSRRVTFTTSPSPLCRCCIGNQMGFSSSGAVMSPQDERRASSLSLVSTGVNPAWPESAWREALEWLRLGGVCLGWRITLSIGGDFQSRMQSQFLEDVVHVAFDGVRRQVQTARDVLVAQAFYNKADDFPLTSGHPNTRDSLASSHRPPRDLREKRPCQGLWKHGTAVRHSVNCADEVC